MPVLLVVHHTPSPSMQGMLESVLEGAHTDGLVGVEVQVRPALAAGPLDVLAADAIVLGTPANIGYMSGALKHFFDIVYYPCLLSKRGIPYGMYVHGDSDTAGAVRAIESIASGLGWEMRVKPVTLVGHPGAEGLRACWELGATLGAQLSG
jgi:multimeric flavodoxin WrbA